MDVLSISLKTSNSLGRINELVLETNGLDRLKAMCKYIAQVVASGKSNIIVVFEAARIQATLAQLTITLGECNVSGEGKELLLAFYENQRDAFIQHLSVIGISMPAIVDVEWRLDYVVRSKHGGRENYPLFLISLKVKDRGLVRSIDFTATQEELQDLLSKVRDGVKQVDRILLSKDK